MMIVEEKNASEQACCGPIAMAKCQGSYCMAWRWVDTSQRNYIDPYGNVSPSIAKEPSTTHGYCGLAGRP